VICDRVIIGVEKIEQITKQRLIDNQHRFSVEAFESFFDIELNPILKEQYQLDDNDLHGMLLSPRAYRLSNGKYEFCEACYRSLKPSQSKKLGSGFKPPKHAIANGFAIGYIPSELWICGKENPREFGISDELISDMMHAAVAIQRPYSYVFAFVGGAHKSVVGQYSFFETNQEHLSNVMHMYQLTGANDHILVVLAGKFTPQQKEIARREATLDTRMYLNLIEWLAKTAKHKGFKDMVLPTECDMPQVVEDFGSNSTDEPCEPATENVFQGGTFNFASTQDPSENTGVFKDPTAFKIAMLNQQSPLALVSGGRYISSGRELLLELIFPLVFPFGLGGLKTKRPTQISELEILKHYTRLSLKQFMRGHVILVINHMYNRIKSYKSGILTCRSTKIYGRPFGEVISTIDEDDIKKASENLSNGKEDNSTAAQFLKRVEASCSAIGYTDAAAKLNRRYMYAICDYIGIPGVFFSLTPCDECAFRVRLWANAGKQLTMPTLHCSDSELIADFQIRKKTRLMYPGACSLEYQSIVQIALKILFGWDSVNQKGLDGIIGQLLAYAIAHEEQGVNTIYKLTCHFRIHNICLLLTVDYHDIQGVKHYTDIGFVGFGFYKNYVITFVLFRHHNIKPDLRVVETPEF
jgi:hypothetical protein